VLFWAIYLAIEPFVRRHWPQTLLSWTRLLSGRVRDPIVGRDVLVGATLGVAIALLARGVNVVVTQEPSWTADEVLLGMRSTVGEVLTHALYGLRSAMFIFFLLFLFRALLRSEWIAAAAMIAFFTLLNVLNSTQPFIDGTQTFLYFSMFAFVVLRWGLTALVVGFVVANALLSVPVTTDWSAWYLGAATFVLLIPVALGSWALHTSTGGGSGVRNCSTPRRRAMASLARLRAIVAIT
jgi:hypothetical protein